MVTFHENRAESLKFIPEDLSRVIKKPEEMSFKELFRYVQNVEAEGYDATTYRVDLQIKIALPLSQSSCALVGTGMAVTKKIKSRFTDGDLLSGLGRPFCTGYLTVFVYPLDMAGYCRRSSLFGRQLCFFMFGFLFIVKC